ncbi:MAG: sulfite exporter TauE/SafE family protein [Gammaproteobacteria bacterium]|jgi:uncharacterized membrane protein YfcA|nr:sulfite exporter TauE/SafE family protein [Gammaproteobacteria bacterium]
MQPLDFALVAAAAFAAGMVNALAGGGTLITFPVMTAVGIPPVMANVTNAVALCPGYFGGTWAQRKDLAGQGARLKLLLPLGALGGVLGAWLLLASGEKLFRALVPWLILGASALLAAQDPLRRWLIKRGRPAGDARLGAALPIASAAVYGGYFGAGLGVVMLATLGLTLDDSLNRLNAVKQALSFVINIAAALFFLGSDQVLWPVVGVMAVAALAGGSLGGRLASVIPAARLRLLVIAIGVGVGLFYLFS